jgi:hypothetical protein
MDSAPSEEAMKERKSVFVLSWGDSRRFCRGEIAEGFCRGEIAEGRDRCKKNRKRSANPERTSKCRSDQN